MGAVTSILYAEANLYKQQAHISCMVLDSPFSKLSTMVDDVGQNQMGIPSFIISIGMSILKSTIKSKIKFDITKLDPLTSSKKLRIPAVFLSAKEDKLVLPKRMAEYFHSYSQQKKRFLESAYEHNSDREVELLEQAFMFVLEVLETETDEEIANLGVDTAYVSRSRKFSEEDKMSRAKSRDLDYHLEGVEREELAMFFNNMDLMRDSPPKNLKANLSIFDEDEHTELDFETRAKLMKISGQNTAINQSSSYEPITIRPKRPLDSNAIIPNQQAAENDPGSRIKVLGRGPIVVSNQQHSNQPSIHQWGRQDTPTYVTKLKEEQPELKAKRPRSVNSSKSNVHITMHKQIIPHLEPGEVISSY